MKAQTALGLLLSVFSSVALAAAPEIKIATAAAKYFPEVSWRVDSVLSGDFSCHGRKEWAILGTNATDVVVAIFLHGASKNPEILRFRPRVLDSAITKLEVYSLDLDPSPDLGYKLPGFYRSKICKGLSIDDGRPDPSNIYWNHDSHKFEAWSY